MICLICKTQCATDSNVCESPDCAFKSNHEFMFDDFLSGYISSNKDEFKLIMRLACNCALNVKLQGSPQSYLFSRPPAIDGPIIDTVIRITKLSFLKPIIDDCKTDQDIIALISIDDYRMIKFIIKNAIMEFKSEEFPESSIDCYKFIYSDVANDTFETEANHQGMTYLFHGSPPHNWYSIISNGLKVFSHTTRMKNGSRFGTGIYLSDSFDVSANYATDTMGVLIVGVFEVLGDVSKYKKNTSVFVVPNEANARIKYLLIAKSRPSLGKELSRYFTSKKPKIVTDVKSYVSNVKNKRLLVEIDRIMKQQTANRDFKLCEIESTNVWNVLLMIDKDTLLFSDMRNASIDSIHLEIRFENSFPMSPPFVRVISPKFKIMTGHITQGGSVCAEILTNQGWSPATSIESLIISIKAIISEDGRLDARNGSDYSLEMAKNSYSNMLKVHGWN